MPRFTPIVLDELPEMQVIETIDSETIISTRMSKLVEFWKTADPPAAAVYDVDTLEFDPLRINQEASTYFETLLRDRVNQAARAVTTAYAVGGDLDAIASRYPSGVPRLPLVDDPRDFDEYPEDWEDDDRYRERIWLAPSLLSPHGSYEAYVYWAMTADATLHDASAMSERGTGKITVTIMAGYYGEEPTPTDAQMNAVLDYINAESRRGLGDDVNVLPPKITRVAYRVRVWLFPAYNKDTVMAAVAAAVDKLLQDQWWLGCDHTRMALDKALAQPGVYNAIIDEPADDIDVDADGLVLVTSVTLTYAGRGE
jgi:phage-related baseplate assembly protein